jgi:hypothetical protein
VRDVTILCIHANLQEALGPSWEADIKFWVAMVDSLGNKPPYDYTRIDCEYGHYVLGRADEDVSVKNPVSTDELSAPTQMETNHVAELMVAATIPMAFIAGVSHRNISVPDVFVN